MNGMRIDFRKSSHMGIVGMTGSGKTMQLKRSIDLAFNAERRFGKKLRRKIIYFDQGNYSSCFMMWPSTSKEWKKKNEDLENPGKYIKAVGKAISIWSPIGATKPKTVIPYNMKYFTIPLTSLDAQEFSIPFGEKIPMNIEGGLKMVFSQLSPDDSFPTFMTKLQKLANSSYIKNSMGLNVKSPTAHSLSNLQAFLYLLLENKIISNSRNPLNLDFKAENETYGMFEKELRDTSKVTIIAIPNSLDPKIKLFLMSYFLRIIYALADQNKIPRSIIAIEELSSYIPKNSFDKAKMVLKEQFITMAKMARVKGLSLWCDFQSLMDVSNIFQAQLEYLIIGKLNSNKDFELCINPDMKHYFTKEDYRNLATLKKYQFCCITPFGIMSKTDGIESLSRHMEEMEDFFKLCRKKDVPFYDVEDKLIFLDKEYKDSIKAYNQNVKLQDEMDKKNNKKGDFLQSLPFEIIKKPYFKRIDVQKICGVSESQATKFIQKWKTAGVVKKYISKKIKSAYKTS